VVLTRHSLLLFYLKLLVWPAGLSPFYELLFVSHPTLRNTIFPTLVLLLVAGGLWKWASRMRPVALVVPWLVFPILPVLNIQIFGNGNFAHDRYLYLPSVGFALLISLALRRLNLGKRSFCGIPTGQGFVCLGLAVFLGVVINLEDRYYASDAAFYSFAYSRMESRYPGIIMDFANTLAERGDFDPAAKLYRQLIQAYPDMWTAYQNLGTMYYHQNQLDEAAQYLSRAAAGDPTLAGAFFYLGITDLKLNRLDEAETNLRRAVALTPMTPNYHFTLGIVLKVKGNRREALVEFKKELELNPGH
jgi:tetratricopeptide (TPR) repeat protein